MSDPFDVLRHSPGGPPREEAIDPRFRAALLAEARHRLSGDASTVRWRAPADTHQPEPMETNLMPTDHPNRARPFMLAAACVALVVAGVVAIVAATDSGDVGPAAPADSSQPADASKDAAVSTSRANPPVTNPPATPAVSEADSESSLVTPIADAASSITELPYDPAYITVADGLIWITRWLDGGVEARSLSDLTVVGAVDDVQNSGSESIVRPLVAFGSAWTRTSEAVFRIDPATIDVVARIGLPGSGGNGGQLSAVAAAPDGVWTLSHQPEGASAVLIDPDTNQVARELPVAGVPGSIGFGADSLWLVHGFDGPSITRVDPRDGATSASIDLPFVPHAIIGDESGIWVTGQEVGDGELWSPLGAWMVGRIDAATNAVVASIEVANPGTSIALAEQDFAVGDSSVWMTTPDGAVRIDTSLNAVATVYEGAGDGGIAVDDESAWIVDKLDRTLYRIPLDP